MDTTKLQKSEVIDNFKCKKKSKSDRKKLIADYLKRKEIKYHPKKKEDEIKRQQRIDKIKKNNLPAKSEIREQNKLDRISYRDAESKRRLREKEENIKYASKHIKYASEFHRDTNSGSRNFSDKQRSEIYLRDKGICQICRKKVSIKKYDCDHIKPYSKGGKTVTYNGQVTCFSCNRSKGNRD